MGGKLHLETGDLTRKGRLTLPGRLCLLRHLGLCLCVCLVELVLQRRPLLPRLGSCALQSQLAFAGSRIELSLQLGRLLLSRGDATVRLAPLLGPRGFHLCLVHMASLGQTRREVLGKEIVSELTCQVLHRRRVDVYDFAAVGTGYLCHGILLRRCCMGTTIPQAPDTSYTDVPRIRGLDATIASRTRAPGDIHVIPMLRPQLQTSRGQRGRAFGASLAERAACAVPDPS